MRVGHKQAAIQKTHFKKKNTARLGDAISCQMKLAGRFSSATGGGGLSKKRGKLDSRGT